MAVFKNYYNVDLGGKNFPRALDSMVCQDNVGGNQVGAYVYENGEAVALGGTCTGKVIRADGSTVALSGDGCVVSGNLLYVTLTSQCYEIPGMIEVIVNSVRYSATTTIVKAFGTVERTTTGAVVPSSVIPNLDQLLAQIAAMEEATADAEAIITMLADLYSASSAYAVGDYCIHDGVFYRCTTAIAAPGEAWNSAHWTATNVGAEINSRVRSEALQRTAADANILAQLAKPFDQSTAFAVGDYCIYQDELYVFTSAHAAGAWNSSQVSKVKLGNQVTDLKSAIDDTKNALRLIGDNSLTLSNVPFTSGSAINNSGVAQSVGVTTWAYSDFIVIPIDALILDTNAVSASGSFGLAFYDDGKNFISGSFVGNYNNPTIEIQKTYKYVRLTNYNASSTHTGISVTFTNKEAWINKSMSMLSDGEYAYSNVVFTAAKAINSTGIEAGTSGATTWACSDFIEVPNLSSVMKTNAISAASTFGLAFYDVKKQFISGSFLGSYSSPTVPVLSTYKYVRITNYNANSSHTGISVVFENKNSLIGNGIRKETSTNLADVIKGATRLSGTYTLNSVITLAENQNIIGTDCVVTVADGGQIRMVSGCSISGIKFVGSWNPTREDGDGTTYTEYGYVPLISYQDLYDGDTDALFGEDKTYSDAVIYMVANSSQNTRVDGCIFENIDRLAIFAGGRRHKEKDNPVVCNNYFSDCRMCVYVHGEFERIYANEYFRCIIGVDIAGANTNSFGEVFKCCDVAYYFPAGNNAHDEITSCEAAHCGLAGIYAKVINATVGVQVTGSHFPDAPIVGDAVNNLMFVGCRLDTWFKYDSGQHNAIMCSNIGKGYLYGNSLFDVPSDTLITLNRGMGATPDADVNWPVS